MALATLMPVVARVGDNSGNQTVALIISALALDRIAPGHTAHLVKKETKVALVNGAIWGTLMGLRRLGRDPAQGASVLLPFTTDGMGFFIFLGLAQVFLV